ncbi:MAG: cell division protein FtsH, partial [Actinomycetota bacterium]
VAEELKIGDITTGAGDDIRKATATAKEMVTQYGMSSRLGPITLGQRDSQPFLGKEFGHQPDYSGQLAHTIDEEVTALLDEAHDEALQILVENDHVLEAMAAKLLEVESVDGKLLAEVFAPVNHRPSRALTVPPAGDPEDVIARLRRLPAASDGPAASNGHAGAGNGHPEQDHDSSSGQAAPKQS